MVYDEKERKEYATVGKDRYPINDKRHAKAALATPDQQYGSIQWTDTAGGPRIEHGAWSRAAWRSLS